MRHYIVTMFVEGESLEEVKEAIGAAVVRAPDGIKIDRHYVRHDPLWHEAPYDMIEETNDELVYSKGIY
jgi:hypothetical protein